MKGNPNERQRKPTSGKKETNVQGNRKKQSGTTGAPNRKGRPVNSKNATGKSTTPRVRPEVDDSTALAKTLNEQHKKKVEKERFLGSRMWLSTLISKFFTDRGTIPDNIGNNILITNNVYTTKNNISAIIFVTEMSEFTPISWTSDLVKFVKDQTEGVTVDFTFKGQHYYPDLTPTGIGSREKSWRMTLDNPVMPEEYVRRSARCLYSLDVARSGVKLYKFRVFITVRASDGSKIKKGISAVTQYLSKYGAKYKRIQSNLDEYLAYLVLMSDKKPEHLKDLPPCIFSLQTLSESMPDIQGVNDNKGVLMGFDVRSGMPYLIDFVSTSAAKNIMIEALSGWGKTFMASYWLYPFYASGFNLSIMDIKGTEFGAITEALHGVTLSMRNTSTKYINSFCWRMDEVFDGDYITYANERFRVSKAKMLIMCDLPEKEESQAEALLEEFLKYVYKSIGASNENTNTWFRTEKLNPYVIFDMFDKYLSNEILRKYKEVAMKMLERLRIYMSRSGSKSHIFRDPYSYIEVLDSRCLTFDFGILESSTNSDRVLFHLHVLDMTTINDEYVSYKKRNHQWTVKLLEESQIADDWLLEVYTREMTLRRAQNQVTVLLGNSVAALAANPLSRPMVENINILCLGSLNKSSRRFLNDEFGLKNSEADLLEDIQTNPDRERQFLLVNRMESDSTTALLEARVPEEVSQSSLFKVVDIVAE